VFEDHTITICSDIPLLDEIYTCIVRFIIRGEYLPVGRNRVKPVDLVELGFARFFPPGQHLSSQHLEPPLEPPLGTPPEPLILKNVTIDEPIAAYALLAYLEKEKPFEVHLQNRWKEKEVRGYVYEDMAVLAIYKALTQKDGCRLDSILNFHNVKPPWASEIARLVALRNTPAGLETVPVSNLTLPYASKCKTWDQTVLWFQGHLPNPICLPDDYMGPDLLCFVTVPSQTTPILLGFQIWSGEHKTLLSAARTINPALYWMTHVGINHILQLPFLLIFFSYSSEIRIPSHTRIAWHLQLTTSSLP